jgi:hypothetical protein
MTWIIRLCDESKFAHEAFSTSARCQNNRTSYGFTGIKIGPFTFYTPEGDKHFKDWYRKESDVCTLLNEKNHGALLNSITLSLLARRQELLRKEACNKFTNLKVVEEMLPVDHNEHKTP